MSLKEIPDDLKIKMFNRIVELYGRDTDIKDFGKDVEELLVQIGNLYQ